MYAVKLYSLGRSFGLYDDFDPYLSDGRKQPVLKRFLMEREAGSFASRE